MKNKFLKFMAALLVAVFMLASFEPVSVEAASNKLTANKAKVVTIDGNKTVKLSFKVPDNGVTQFKFEGVANWINEIKIKVGYKTIDELAYLDEGNDAFSACFSLKKGTKVTVELTGDDDYVNKCQVKAVFKKKTKDFEIEKNDTKSKANKLTLKKACEGYISDNYRYPCDKCDWYVFKATKNGRYKVMGVVTENHGDDSYVYPTVYLGSKELKSVYDFGDGDGWTSLLENGSIYMKKGQKLYIKLSSEGYGYVNYKIKVTK